MQWLKLPAWKVKDRGFEPRSGTKVSEKQNVSFSLTRKKFNIVGSLRDREVRSRPQTARVQISNPLSGGQCHLIHPTILRMFSWPGLAYLYTMVD